MVGNRLNNTVCVKRRHIQENESALICGFGHIGMSGLKPCPNLFQFSILVSFCNISCFNDHKNDDDDDEDAGQAFQMANWVKPY